MRTRATESQQQRVCDCEVKPACCFLSCLTRGGTLLFLAWRWLIWGRGRGEEARRFASSVGRLPAPLLSSLLLLLLSSLLLLCFLLCFFFCLLFCLFFCFLLCFFLRFLLPFFLTLLGKLAGFLRNAEAKRSAQSKINSAHAIDHTSRHSQTKGASMMQMLPSHRKSWILCLGLLSDDAHSHVSWLPGPVRSTHHDRGNANNSCCSSTLGV